MSDSVENPAAALAAGETEFLGVKLQVMAGALVPRAETELLARAVVEALGEMGSGAGAERVAVDMCCGVGNVGVVMAVRHAGVRVYAADLTEACVEATQRNVALHGLEGRMTVVRGDLFEPLRGLGLEGRVDVVACNPPYISTSRLAGEAAHLLEHEPREAFDAGPYGMGIHARVINEAPGFLRAGGVLAFEFGVGQQKQLELLFKRSRVFGGVRFLKDGEGRERVAVGVYSPEGG